MTDSTPATAPPQDQPDPPALAADIPRCTPSTLSGCRGETLHAPSCRFATRPAPDSAARPAEAIARHFHEEYERLAPAYGYETRKESAVPWEDVPEQNKRLMTHVVANLLISDVIDVGSAVKEVLHVRDFGAVCDGEVDDRDAVAACLKAAHAAQRNVR